MTEQVAGLTGEPAGSAVRWQYGETIITEPVVEAGSIESVWRRLVESGRPAMQIDSTAETMLHWAAKLERIRLLGTSMTLQSHDGLAVALPLAYPIRDITLERGAVLNIRKHVQYLVVEPRQAA